MKHLLTGTESRVLSLIPRGSGHPILINDIVNITGIERRTVQAAIEEMVVKYRIPIVSIRGGFDDRKGVYIATNDHERQEGLVSLKSQVAENQKRIQAVEGADLENWMEGIHIQTDLIAEFYEDEASSQ